MPAKAYRGTPNGNINICSDSDPPDFPNPGSTPLLLPPFQGIVNGEGMGTPFPQAKEDQPSTSSGLATVKSGRF